VFFKFLFSVGIGSVVETVVETVAAVVVLK
jgi:hypothetical protein